MMGYKIVNRRLSSIFIKQRGETKFKIGNYINRNKNCGPITVFSNYTGLIEFLRLLDYWHITDYRIFTCEYCPSNETEIWTPELHKDEKNHELMTEGSALAENVKLLKELDMRTINTN
jgi:hypothetical protein